MQAHLIDKSLVFLEHARAGEARYRLLGTIRQYAADRLVEAGEAAATRDRHFDWYLGLAQQASPELRGPRQAEWLDRLEQEHDNLRVALEWSMAREDDGEPALQLAGALGRFWYVRSYFGEGSHWLEVTRAKAGGAAPSVRARALRWSATLALQQGSRDQAGKLLAQALELYRELDDKRGLARALTSMGNVHLYGSEHHLARACYEEGLAAAREVGDTPYIATSLGNLGELARLRGDLEAARALYQESLEAHGENETQGRAVSMFNLGQLALVANDSRTARGLYQGSLAISVKLGARSTIAYALEGLAGVAMLEGQPERAGRLLGRAEALRKAINAQMDASDLPLHERTVSAVRAVLGEEEFTAARTAGAGLSLERAVQLGLEEAPPNAQPMTAPDRDRA
jgi:non-specific serine/threonine protein kinase